jgi:hypothetical protein
MCLQHVDVSRLCPGVPLFLRICTGQCYLRLRQPVTDLRGVHIG